MHRFNLKDAQILLGLSAMDDGYANSCAGLVAQCAAICLQIPTADEFATAFNKFLYISAIVVDGHTVALAPFGRAIIDKARIKAEAGASPMELQELLYKELSGYKLKSMCNRKIWTPLQYQQAIAANT